MPVLAVVGLVVAWILVAAFVTRARHEARTRLLEALAQAVRRGMPLPPMVAAAAEEESGRRRASLERIAARLEAGTPLADALAPEWPRRLVAAVRAVEGTPRLGDALATLNDDAATSRGIRHRLSLAAIYPGALLVMAAGFTWLSKTVYRGAEIAGSRDWRELELKIPLVALALLGFGIVMRIAGAFPGRRFAERERLLRALAPLLADGMPLPEALRRAADASGSRALAREVRRAASRVEQGVPPDEVLGRLDLPTRPKELEQAAEVCARRFEREVAHWFRWAQPVALAVIGLLLAVHFGALAEFMANAQVAAEGVLW